MERKIIALFGVANVGKTQTIKKAYELLISKYPNATKEIIRNNYDIQVIVTINGVKIGIESQGDPNSRLFDSIKLFVKVGCQVIICATRTKGATVKAVIDQKPEYNVVWYKQKIDREEATQKQSNLNMAETLIAETEKHMQT